MCEVSQLDYILAKIYLEEDGSLKDPKADPALADINEVLLRYALAVGDGITYEEAMDKILRLGPPLVSHMESSTGLAWKQTSIYAWLVRELKVCSRGHQYTARLFPLLLTSPTEQGALAQELQPRHVADAPCHFCAHRVACPCTRNYPEGTTDAAATLSAPDARI